MSGPTQFFCSRVERGQTACEAQCTDCHKRINDAAALQQQATAPEPPKNQDAQQQKQNVRAQIVITLFENGDANVNGPFDDRVLFHGMLFVAAEVERLQFAQRMAQRQREMNQKPEPWARRLFKRLQSGAK